MKFNFIIILLLLVMLASNGLAQEKESGNMESSLTWGVEAGVNLPSSAPKNNPLGFKAAATLEYTLTSHWLLNTSIGLGSRPFQRSYSFGYISASEQTIAYNNDYAEPTHHISERYNPYYLSIPIRLGYRFYLQKKSSLDLSCGPQFGIGLFGTGRYTDNGITWNTIPNIFSNKEDYPFATSRFAYGASAQVGINFLDHWNLSTEYSLMNSSRFSDTDSFNTISFSIAYKF